MALQKEEGRSNRLFSDLRFAGSMDERNREKIYIFFLKIGYCRGYLSPSILHKFLPSLQYPLQNIQR